MGSPLQSEQICVLDNNSRLSAVFSKYCKNCPGRGYDNVKSRTFKSNQRKKVVIQDDGFSLAGYPASDSMCIGMWGNRDQFKDPETSVCQDNQFFFLVTSQDGWNWSAQATLDSKINAVCGLGYEKATPDAEGWLAKAVYTGDISKNVYSVQFVP